jgi:hypothetical protein
MFESDSRYITCGVQKGIATELQVFMWNCINELRKLGKEMDYLQVFELTSEEGEDGLVQRIEHRQEIPEFRKTYVVLCEEPITAKIFVIDDGAYSTMLLAEEY